MLSKLARLAAYAVIAFLVSPATAHETPTGWKYDAVCCNGNATHGDCHHIPRTSVRAVEGGWLVTLNPGDHPLVTKTHQWLKPYDDTRESKDEDFHACLWPTEDTLRCLYVPNMGM